MAFHETVRLPAEDRERVTALMVAERASAYVFVRVPLRPHNLPSIMEIVDLVEDEQRGANLASDKKKHAQLFGAWRGSVLGRELLNAYHASLLCWAFRIADRLGLVEPAEKLLEALITFGTIDWGQAPEDWHSLGLWARSKLVDKKELPDELRRAGAR